MIVNLSDLSSEAVKYFLEVVDGGLSSTRFPLETNDSEHAKEEFLKMKKSKSN